MEDIREDFPDPTVPTMATKLPMKYQNQIKIVIKILKSIFDDKVSLSGEQNVPEVKYSCCVKKR
jgi:hypothetical protein